MIPKHNTRIPKMAGMGGCYCGRRGLPPEAIEIMYQDYLRLGSLAKVGKLHGRTRQNMWDIFARRNKQLNRRNFQPQVEYAGMRFTAQKTSGKHRYLRDTGRRTKTVYLHHVVWEQHHGPIPPGHKLAFRDGDHTNCDISNLELLTNSEQVKKYASKGQNQFTKVADANLRTLVGNFTSGKRTLATAIKI